MCITDKYNLDGKCTLVTSNRNIADHMTRLKTNWLKTQLCLAMMFDKPTVINEIRKYHAE